MGLHFITRVGLMIHIYFILVILISPTTTCFASCSLQKNSEVKQTPNNIRILKEDKFKIVIFADLHYGEAPDTDWGPGADLKSTNVTTNILQWEDPDFVVFTGDQLTAEFMYPNASEYVRMLVSPLVQRGYRWASTYGNHDIGPNVTRLEILRAEQEYPDLSYTTQINASLPGVTNYYLGLYPPDGEVPLMIWWFFDSQGGRNNDGQQPHYIDTKVVVWFREEHAKLKELWGPLPSLVFFHIPPIEYEQIQEDLPSNPMCSGLVDDDVTAQDLNTGIMKTLAEVGGVQGVYVGHDHGNGWCCFYKEIQVCYNRHTGYGGYGTWVRGARVIQLDPEDLTNIRSYVRLETGEIVDEFPKLDLKN